MIKTIKNQSSFFNQNCVGCVYFQAAAPLPTDMIAMGHPGFPAVTATDITGNTISYLT
jgi:hypothetical protein